MIRYLTLIAGLPLLFIACEDPGQTTPKPRIFPKVDYPEKSYQSFDLKDCPFRFEYPTYAELVRDSLYFGEKVEHPCWFNIVFPELGAELYCTYHEVSNRREYDKYVRDAFTIAAKINDRSHYMEEIPLKDPGGLIFRFKGPAASPMQFYLSDTSRHFLKSALYFHSEVRPDSLKPVIEFIEKDLYHMIGTFEWDQREHSSEK